MEGTEEGFEFVEGIEEDFCDETDESERDNIIYIINFLQRVAVENVEAFQNGSDASDHKMHSLFCLLDQHLDGMEPTVRAIMDIARHYDFNGLRANGYRSLLKILYKCCKHILLLSEEIKQGKDNFFLSMRSGYRDLDSFIAYLGQLKTCCTHIQVLPHTAEKGCLFSKTDDTLFSVETEKTLSDLEELNREPFYGRCLGHQFVKSMQNALKVINVAMASFGESWNKESVVNKWASSLMSSGKYFMNPELRAQQVVKTTQNSSIAFCKAFWNVSETGVLQEFPMVVCPPVQVSHAFELPPEPLKVPSADGSEMVNVPIPSAHHGPRPINVRLISHTFREGQEQLVQRDPSQVTKEPQSRCLIIHCHGGGFVAQSSKSHEMYLRHWAKNVGVPILSVDYSLAPESPYPRAVEEIFYAYCWALDNSDLLGSSGDRICFVGDSSGANLMLATCLKAIIEGVPLPDGILSVYGATYVSYAPSPSRLLAVMDPLLPVGVLSRCLSAYAGFDSRDVFQSYVNKRRQMNDGYMDPLIKEKLAQIERAQEAEKPSGPTIIRPSSSTNANHASNSSKNSEKTTPSVHSPPKPNRPPPPKSSPKKTSPALSNGSKSEIESKSNVENKVEQKSVNSLPKPPRPPPPRTKSGDGDQDLAVRQTERTDSKTDDTVTLRDGSVSDSRGVEEPSSPIRKCLSHSELPTSSETCGLVTPTAPSTVEFNPLTKPPSNTGPDSVNTISAAVGGAEWYVKPPTLPHRSNTTSDFTSLSNREKQASFNWSSFMSNSTKTKIKNNLTSFGNMMWGSGPNHSKKITYKDGNNQCVLGPETTLPLHAYRYLPVPADPLMSPYCAPLDLLAKMPPVYLLACHLDPLLDDSIEFAKRLEEAGAEVHLDVLDDLPHGFLNFTLLSREAKMGCDTCVVRMRQILLHTPR